MSIRGKMGILVYISRGLGNCWFVFCPLCPGTTPPGPAFLTSTWASQHALCGRSSTSSSTLKVKGAGRLWKWSTVRCTYGLEAQAHTHIHVPCMHALSQTHTHTHTHTSVHAGTHAHTHTHTHTGSQTGRQTYTHTHTHPTNPPSTPTPPCIHTHTHTHTWG